jgi:putative transposase
MTRLARQAPPFRAGKDSADRVAVLEFSILSRRMRMRRDEGQDMGDASPGMLRGCSRRVSPDGLWIEPHWRSEAGTRRSDSEVAQCRA